MIYKKEEFSGNWKSLKPNKCYLFWNTRDIIDENEIKQKIKSYSLAIEAIEGDCKIPNSGKFSKENIKDIIKFRAEIKKWEKWGKKPLKKKYKVTSYRLIFNNRSVCLTWTIKEARRISKQYEKNRGVKW